MTSTAFVHRRMTVLAEPFGGVLSRELLRGAGIDRGGISRQVSAERWRVVGRQTVAVHTGSLSLLGAAWRAVWEVGRGDVAVDGASALQLAGLTGFDAAVVDVSVPWEARVTTVPGVRIHRVCRREGELSGSGVPRVVVARAAIRAANWAVSDRQAALLLALPVQQRLVRTSDLRRGDVE